MEKIKIAAVGDGAIMRQPVRLPFQPACEAYDLFLANLEGPIVSSEGVPAEKPIRLRLPKEAAAWLKEMGVDAVSLANNHLMDWGIEGFKETISELDQAGISHAGAGKDAQEAAAPIYFDIYGHKIAFLSWAATVPSGFKALQNRPGIAGIKVRTSFIVDSDIDEQPGSPPWVCTEAMEEDLKSLEDSIQLACSASDFTILAMHWGIPPKESSNAQGCIADYQLQIMERAVKAGAGIIIGHHCHTPLGMQICDGVPVLFSLGNYIFHSDYYPGGLDFSASPVPYHYNPGNKDSCFTHIELSCEDNGSISVERIMTYLCTLNEFGEAMEATKENAASIASRLHDFSVNRNANVKNVDDILVWEAKNPSINQEVDYNNEAETRV